MPPRSSISFLQDDKIRTIDFDSDEFKPTTTVLQYLRNSALHKGTKEGCAEGDCGACTVVLGELDHEHRIKYKAIDSCLVFLPMLHGKQLITIENLSTHENKDVILHPVQQTMVEMNGSQCGYCTPGFIMSLFALYKTKNDPSKEDIDDALTGNLCRCTGYKPIVKAASAACVHHGTDQFSKKEKEILPWLLKMQEDLTAIAIKTGKQNYFQPKTVAEALQLKAAFPDAILIGGATDIALRVTKKNELLSALIDLSAIQEIKQFEKKNHAFIIGSGLDLETLKSRTESELPALYNMLLVFGSKQIRLLATMGGNIGSASPIGDTIPVLMAYDATIHLQSINGEREFNINNFITGYRQTKRESTEIITSVSIPVPDKGCIIRSYKVSKRKDLDISTVNAGFRLKLTNTLVDEIILAFGGVAATTVRAIQAENFLKGKTWDRKTVEEASQIICNEFTPISDARSGAAFRKIVAGNLLIKFWNDTRQ